MAHCVGTTFGSFLDCQLHCAAWLCTNQFEALEYLYGGCASCAFVSALFINCLAACLSSSCLVSICLLLSIFLSKKKFMACTGHVSHPFDSVHILFVALYCMKSQETYRVRKASFRAVLQLRNGVKGRTRALAFYTQTLLAFGSARVRICRVLNSQLPRLRITTGGLKCALLWFQLQDLYKY